MKKLIILLFTLLFISCSSTKNTVITDDFVSDSYEYLIDGCLSEYHDCNIFYKKWHQSILTWANKNSLAITSDNDESKTIIFKDVCFNGRGNMYWEDITITFPVDENNNMHLYATCTNFRITTKQRRLKNEEYHYLHFYHLPLISDLRSSME